MNRLLELLSGKPFPVSRSPVFPSVVRPAMPQKEGQELMPCPHELHRRVGPRPDKIAHSFVNLIRDPHGSQVPERCSMASFWESRRSVLIRSAGREGILEGATTMQP